MCRLRAVPFGGWATVVLQRAPIVIIEELWVRFAKYHALSLLAAFSLCWLLQAHTRAATVFINEPRPPQPAVLKQQQKSGFVSPIGVSKAVQSICGSCPWPLCVTGVIACPAQRQSAEAVRKLRELLCRVGAELKIDNVYGLELKNGSRVLALPGSDDSIRGLTVDGWIVADEAA